MSHEFAFASHPETSLAFSMGKFLGSPAREKKAQKVQSLCHGKTIKKSEIFYG
jgi:hypothetical protein